MKNNIKTTQEQDLAIGTDLFHLFQEGESYNLGFAIALLKHTLKKNKVFDTEGKAINVTIDMFQKFGIFGHASTFVSDTGKEKPIFCITKTAIAVNSPDWLKKDQ
jgi:hypothetical protein